MPNGSSIYKHFAPSITTKIFYASGRAQNTQITKRERRIFKKTFSLLGRSLLTASVTVAGSNAGHFFHSSLYISPYVQHEALYSTGVHPRTVASERLAWSSTLWLLSVRPVHWLYHWKVVRFSLKTALINWSLQRCNVVFSFAVRTEFLNTI
jgi:hypothetical protein